MFKDISEIVGSSVLIISSQNSSNDALYETKQQFHFIYYFYFVEFEGGAHEILLTLNLLCSQGWL